MNDQIWLLRVNHFDCFDSFITFMFFVPLFNDIKYIDVFRKNQTFFADIV